jgi:predicted permease
MIQALGTNPPGQAPRGLQAVGRLRPEVGLEQARAAVTAAWPALRVEAVPAALPAAERAEIARQQMTVAPIGRGFSPLRERYRSALVALAGITVLLWIIGCTNLSGLLLSRLTARRRETAVCLALGATRGVLVRRWTAEGLLLSLIGTALAYPLARAASAGLVSATWSSALPLALSVDPDARVLALMAVMASVTTVVMAALPGWLASARAPLAGSPGSRTATTASGRSRQALLVAQVAISLVLLFGASLFAASLLRLRALDLGVDTAQPRFTRLFAVPGGYDGLDFATYYQALARSLEELPGMRSVAFSSYFPAYWNFPQVLGLDPVARAGALGPESEVESFVEYVSPAFFDTVGIPLVAGRDFTWHDDAGAPGVVVVNEQLAAKLFPDGDVVGRRIRIGGTPERSRLEVVGIAKDATLGALRVGRLPMVFRPRMQEPRFNRVPIVIYRADGDPEAVDDAFRRTVTGYGHEYARARTRTLDEELDIVLLRERLLAWLSGLFAGLALLLVFIGLFAALAFAVTQRAREIGVRMAIGAPRRAVVAMIVREGLLVVGWGSAIGIVVSLAAARITRSLVFDLDPVSPGLALAAAGVFVLVAVAASLWPAYRAASVDPATVLRAE